MTRAGSLSGRGVVSLLLAMRDRSLLGGAEIRTQRQEKGLDEGERERE
jgi:hypothetical protein